MKEDVLRVKRAVYEECLKRVRACVNGLELLLRCYARPEFKGVSVVFVEDEVTVVIKNWAVDELPKPESMTRARRKLFELLGVKLIDPNCECDMNLINKWCEK